MSSEFKVITKKVITLLPSSITLMPGAIVTGEKFAKYEGIYVERVNAPKPEAQEKAKQESAKTFVEKLTGKKAPKKSSKKASKK